MIKQPSAFEEAVSRVSTKLNKGANIVKNFINSTNQDVQNFTNNFGDGLKANVRSVAQNKAFDAANQKSQRSMIARDMSRFISNPANAIKTAVKALPIKLAQNSLNRDSKRLTPITMQQFEAEDKAFQDQYNRQFPPIMQSDTTDSVFMPWGWDARPANQSAQLSPQPKVYLKPPKSDPELEKLKQEILSDPNMTEATRAYLSNIPIAYENMTDNNGKLTAAGIAHDPHGPGRFIGISDSYKDAPKHVAVTNEKKKQSVQIPNGELETIIKHELLHQTPKGAPLSTFNSKNTKKIDSYINRWGKDYMKRPGALVGEMFAEKDLPPVYYWHIYKNIVPNSTPQNFIDTIKSVFSEPDRFNAAGNNPPPQTFQPTNYWE